MHLDHVDSRFRSKQRVKQQALLQRRERIDCFNVFWLHRFSSKTSAKRKLSDLSRSLRFLDCGGEIFQVGVGPLELSGIGRSNATGIGALAVTNETFQLAQVGRSQLRHRLFAMYVCAVFPAHLQRAVHHTTVQLQRILALTGAGSVCSGSFCRPMKQSRFLHFTDRLLISSEIVKTDLRLRLLSQLSPHCLIRTQIAQHAVTHTAMFHSPYLPLHALETLAVVTPDR